MAQPLAERLRPTSFDNYVGQQHLVGEGAVLRRMIDSGRILSFIRKDYNREYNCQSIESPFLYTQCCFVWRQGGA